MGAPNAPITVVEYADLHCPICASFANNAFATIKSEYVDTGKIRWVFRHYAVVTSNSDIAAQGSECASDQNKFWEFIAAVYANQTQWLGPEASPKSDADTMTSLKALATQLGLSNATFDPCIDGGGKKSRVDSDISSGNALGVTGTPTFFIGNQKVVGFSGTQAFKDSLDSAINCATAAGS